MNITRDEALTLLKEYNKDPFHIKHARTVEGVMRYFAEKLGYSDEADFWGIVGLLHDLDFEQYPEEHLAHTQQPLREAGVDEESIRAILAHGYTLRNEVEPKTDMEKSLFTVDELSGLIAATAKMRPGGVTDLEASSVRKKFKDKRFAAKINRELIQKGCDMLGMQLPEVIAICIGGMREHAEELGIGAKTE